MMPASEVTTPPTSAMSKATSAVYLKPLENQPMEKPPSGHKPQHQQVTRLSQQHNAGIFFIISSFSMQCTEHKSMAIEKNLYVYVDQFV
jgi:hypothetical protein